MLPVSAMREMSGGEGPSEVKHESSGVDEIKVEDSTMQLLQTAVVVKSSTMLLGIGVPPCQAEGVLSLG